MKVIRAPTALHICLRSQIRRIQVLSLASSEGNGEGEMGLVHKFPARIAFRFGRKRGRVSSSERVLPQGRRHAGNGESIPCPA
jgi:hypothetical protein